MALQFGLLVPQGWRMDLVGITDPVEAYETMTRVAQEAEALGYDSIWLFDHFHTVPVPTQEVTFECWTSTAALARDTKRVRIGQLVTCNGYRNPALMAKMASTVDVLSHGRLDFGIGAGWYEHEYRAYGYGILDAITIVSSARPSTTVLSRRLMRKPWPKRGHIRAISLRSAYANGRLSERPRRFAVGSKKSSRREHRRLLSFCRTRKISSRYVCSHKNVWDR